MEKVKKTRCGNNALPVGHVGRYKERDRKGERMKKNKNREEIKEFFYPSESVAKQQQAK